ncbi:hypothetical protein QQF64_024114 [Cirrhinus molitorella]|uniref:Uncharacterized protein n=1 Tax=Cirrhinus molitorella TaxID=172907 RepID=A0ABR3NKX1_9TELE
MILQGRQLCCSVFTQSTFIHSLSSHFFFFLFRDESELLEDDVVSLTSSDPEASALLGSTQEEQEMSEGEEAEAESSQSSCSAYEELLEVMGRATSHPQQHDSVYLKLLRFWSLCSATQEQLHTMFVSALLICVVLRAFSAQAKVDDDFDCKDFFYAGTEPRGMDQNAKKICQWTANFGPHYATLYSVHHRIPLYSAYLFDPKCFTDSGRLNYWHLEPQISKPEEQNLYSMVRETQRTKNTYKEKQATSDDYSETGYDRGHLNPSSFQCREGRIATFTLTNAAPMDACFNRNQWGKWEKTLRIFLRDTLNSDFGSATVYIVTGTVPDENLRIPQREISEEPENSERVTVPSHIWTAVCYKHHSDDRKSFSFGYIGENKPEGSIDLVSVLDLNRRLSGISIFVNDCFHDNNKLDRVKVRFQKLINEQIKEKQGVQMSSDIQTTSNALKRIADSDIAADIKFKVTQLIIKLAFDSIIAYYNAIRNLKISPGSACLLTKVKPVVRSDLRKRDISGSSDAVECLLVPENQKTAADGTPCSSFSDSTYSCDCQTKDGQRKSCCSTPCLYQEDLSSYRCYSGQTLIECSPRYSLVTYKGEQCLDDHPCATYGEDYYWCKKSSGGWDYCSPPLWRSKAKNGKYCRSDHACANYGYGHMWCYTDDQDRSDKCCISDDCYSAVNGKKCRSDHKCGYHNKNEDKDYLWCYTDYEGNWDYCCKSC